MDYNKIPGKIEGLRDELHRCESAITSAEKSVACGKQIQIQLIGSGLKGVEVDTEGLCELLHKQKDKLQREINRLSDVDETLRKVSVGLL